MKNKLLFNLLTPFATSNTQGKTFRNLLALVVVVMGMGFSWGQTNISLEGFETVASTPSFGFTISGGGYTTGSTSSTSSAPLSSPLYSGGSRGYGANNTTTTITSGNISTIGYSSVALSLKLGSFSLTSTGNGADSSDFVKVEVSPNGGTNYYILLWQVGSGNLTWAFGNSSTYTNTYSTSALTTSGNNTAAQNLTITGLPNTTNLRVRITMFNDNAAELWAIDDVKITGTLSCSSPTTQTTSLTSNTITTTSSNYAFTRGNGDNVLVVARLNGTSSVAPTSGTTYTPSTTGSFIGTTTTGTGNIVVYNGAAAGASTASGNLNLTNLTAGSYYTLTAYEYATTGTCYNTTSPASVNFYTLCEAPISTTPATVGSKSFTASWAAVSGASSYKLDVSTDNGFTSFVGIYNDLTVASTSQAITGLNYNTAYYFRVRAINTNNVASADSNISSITTKTVATSLVLVGAPSTANVGVNLTSFTVEARRNDATVDDAYTSSISITKASGSGTISGNSAVAASSGTVTFASIQFNAADTYTISATDGTLTSVTSGNIVVSIANATAILWSSSSSSTWLTPTNWTGGSYPNGNQVAQFAANPTISSGINFNSTTNAGVQINGQKIQEVGALEVSSSRTTSMSIGNSSTTVGANGQLRLNGVVVNSIPYVVIRNNSVESLTLQNTQSMGSQSMVVLLNNINNNNIILDNIGNVVFNSAITNAAGPITISGTGSGSVVFLEQNTYSTTTIVSGSTLVLNRAGGTTIPITNNVTVDGGTLKVSTNQTLNNLNLTSGTIIIDAGVTLTINGTFTRTSGVIKGTNTSNLVITGASGTIAFDQTTPGTTNVLKNLTITGSGTTTLANALNITGGSSSGSVTVGTGATLNTGGFLTFKSDANGTASLGNSAGTISGNVTVERYIPSGKRAFRLLSPAVTTTTFISGNWQGQTHITGGASGGFDVTETNNPSMFTYNNQVASGTGWTPIANTNATNLTAGVGYRMLVRGDRNVNLTVASQDNMNAAITLSATGTLRTGTVTLDASSTPAINNTANTTTANYSLVGNPYQSAVDWHLVTRTGIEDTYYAWAPNMGTGAARGNYVAYNVSTGNSGGGSVGQFIQPGQAFFVKNTVSGTAGTLTFEEADKASTNANVFRTNNQTESTNFATLSTALYDPNELAIGGYPIDAMKAVFGSEYTNELGLGDATKLEAAGENIAWFRNNTKLAIDAAAPVTTSDELVMKTLRLVANKNYTFKIQTTNFDTALTPYLVDNFLNTQTEIATSQAYLATFATTSNVASYNENRFKIVFQNALLNTDTFASQVGLYPNPSKGNGFYLQLPATTQATVRLYNTLGQEIAISHNEGHYQAKQSLAAGVYHIMVTQGEKTSKLKWIVE
jgi:hypothetical protein